MGKIATMIKHACFRIAPLRSFARGMRKAPLWGIDIIRWDEHAFEIEGWALPPQAGPEDAAFTLNGRPFEQVLYPRERDDIGRVFWWFPSSRFSGFHCRTACGSSSVADGTPFYLDYVSKTTGRPFCELHAYAYRPAGSLPMPQAARRCRVQGTESECFFLLEGCSAYTKLQQALQTHVGKCFADFPRALDWGCGCGRLARHFAPGTTSRLTGVDVDWDNVAWCRDNLGFADFQTVPLHPPTTLPAGEFDLLIGISVFTHLGADVQREWLRELRRLAAPGAILLVTVHGLTSALRANRFPHLLRFLASRGCYNMGSCIDLGDFISDAQYYRSMYISQSYIRKHWTKYFDIVDIVPGYIGNNQDLVILRKREE